MSKDGRLRQLSDKRAVVVDLEISKVPVRGRPLFMRSVAGTCSPRQAIKAKCQSCVGYEDSTERIRYCSSYLCPLWSFRPYSKESTKEIGS